MEAAVVSGQKARKNAPLPELLECPKETRDSDVICSWAHKVYHHKKMRRDH